MESLGTLVVTITTLLRSALSLPILLLIVTTLTSESGYKAAAISIGITSMVLMLCIFSFVERILAMNVPFPNIAWAESNKNLAFPRIAYKVALALLCVLTSKTNSALARLTLLILATLTTCYFSMRRVFSTTYHNRRV